MTSLSDTPRETAAQDAAERDMDATPTPALLGPRALIWRKFRRHRLAMASLWIVGAHLPDRRARRIPGADGPA